MSSGNITLPICFTDVTVSQDWCDRLCFDSTESFCVKLKKSSNTEAITINIEVHLLCLCLGMCVCVGNKKDSLFVHVYSVAVLVAVNLAKTKENHSLFLYWGNAPFETTPRLLFALNEKSFSDDSITRMAKLRPTGQSWPASCF